VTRSNGRVVLRDELVLGRRELSARFHNGPARTLERGALLVTAVHSRNVVYHLIAGWACQFREFSTFHQAIVDFYLPGDVVGLGAVVPSRPVEKVMSLTSLTIEVIDATDAVVGLMRCGSTALYIAWLLGQQQQRSDRLVAALSSLDARGRVATMLLDFHERLSRQRLVTGLTYNLPLTQIQIGLYLGLTVAHVNRVLRSLRSERIANLEKHCVTILDLERLTRLTENAPSPNPSDRLLDEPLPPSSQLTRIRAEPSRRGLRIAAFPGVPAPR
jgi:CRP-like cAMP-binding protein